MKRPPLFLALALCVASANARLEFSHISTKGYSSYGAGAMFPDGYIHQPDIEGGSVWCTAGYIFPGRFGLDTGLRYGHIFGVDGSAANILSLRFGHTFLFGRERFR